MTKKPKTKIKLKMVYVSWHDASYQDGECTIDELHPLIRLDSCGILVREDARTITIATDYCADDETWRHISHIPKVNIVKLRRYAVG